MPGWRRLRQDRDSRDEQKNKTESDDIHAHKSRLQYRSYQWTGVHRHKGKSK